MSPEPTGDAPAVARASRPRGREIVAWVLATGLAGLCFALLAGRRRARCPWLSAADVVHWPVDFDASSGKLVSAASRPFVLYLTGDVKLTIPDDVKAVYVGTLVYYHNGQEATRIEVRNEFATAMTHLAKWEIPGIRPEDVVERLAQVVRQP